VAATEQSSSGCGQAVAFAFAGAVVVGSTGFIAGFVGPILLTPEANQGPLLEIFITSPLGALLGALIGAIWSTFRTRQKK